MLRTPFLSFVCAVLLFPGAVLAQAPDTRQEASLLFKEKKYADLEALAARLRAEPTAITERMPPLDLFYRSFEIERNASDKAWLRRKAALEAWLAAVPESVVARVALADWWTGYAWKARGSGWASTVTEEGRRLMLERLAEAARVLEEAPEQKVNDPAFYNQWITIALGQGWKPAQTRRSFNYGTTANKTYHPLYRNFTYWLAPRWHGEAGDWQAFAAEMAATFPQKEGDWLYLQLVGSRVDDFEKTNIIEEGGLDMERVNRAIATALAEPKSLPDEWTRNVACYLAAKKGDHPAAAQLFLEIEGESYNDLFHGRSNLLSLRRATGVEEKIEAAYALETAGDLKGAEAAYTAFNPRRETNGWLRRFYLRQGMEAPYRAHPGLDAPYTTADPATAPLNEAWYIAQINLMLGHWEVARTAAQRFDEGRPWNLLGKSTLFLLAAQQGDTAAAERLRESVLATKSDRTAFQMVQSVMKGEKSWVAAWAYFKNDGDQYAAQSVLTLAAWKLASGDKAQARTLAEIIVAHYANEPTIENVARSLLHGSLAPLLKE